MELLERRYLEAVDRDVLKSHALAAAQLDTGYVAALDKALAAATSSENLTEALALRAEKKLIETKQPIPGNDADNPPATLARLRKSYAAALTKLQMERDRQILPLHKKYASVLLEYQNSLTKSGDLDGAALVAQKLKELAAQADVLQRKEPALAKVVVENSEIAPFRKGIKVYGDRDQFEWDILPVEFSGFRFCRARKVLAPTLRFKVLSPGLVYMACTNRWNNSGANSENIPDLISQDQLLTMGWKLHPATSAQATNEPHSWVFFFRECKAGDSFVIRTEKYASPIILVKD